MNDVVVLALVLVGYVVLGAWLVHVVRVAHHSAQESASRARRVQSGASHRVAQKPRQIDGGER